MKDATEMKLHNSDASGVRTTSSAHAPAKENAAAKLTILTSEYPKLLTKQIQLGNNGKLIKIPSANLAKGDAEVVHVDSMQELSELLQSLEYNQALVYGTPTEGLSKAKVVTAKALESRSDTEGYISRTNEHFAWPTTPGVMMFDYDPDGQAIDGDAVLDLLYKVCPAIKSVDHLWWTSSSSNIVNSDTGARLSGVTGQRVYLMVKDATDIPRAAKAIEERLWLAGHGYIKISKSGAMLERVPFDMSVYQPSRLDFAAGASCVAPLEQDRGTPTLKKGSGASLDTGLDLPDLSESEQQQLAELKAGKTYMAKPKANAARTEYVNSMKQKINSPYLGHKDEDVMSVIEHIFETGELPPFWILHVWNGSELVNVTVEDVMSDKHAYDGQLCLDPIEPEYDECRLVGKLFLDQRNPRLYSFARGGRTFSLEEFEHKIVIEGNLHNAVNETLALLEKRKDAFTFGGVLVTPINGVLNYLDTPKMKHLLGRFIQYESLTKLCNPTNELVEGVSSIGVAKNINPIKGFVDHPVMDSELRMLLKPGYNKQMQVLGDFDQINFDVTDRKLDAQEVIFHWNRIFAPFTHFELEGNDGRTILAAAIFSAVLRQVLPTCPAFGFDAPVQGTGKTLLAETIAIIGSGKKPSALAPGRSDYDEEFRKRLMALFLNGEKVCNFDNIVGTFDSPSFAAALTSETYEDRILGKSKTGKILNKTLFLLTGNNMQFFGDMSRRVLKARLVPKDSKLAQRKYEFDPRDKALSMRFEIISSVLSLVNHWKQCGQQKRPGTMTSFSEWDRLVRQPLAFIGQQHSQTGLIDVLDVSLKQQSDSSDKDALVNLLKEIAARFGEGRRFKGTDALIAMKDSSRFGDAVLAFKSKEELRSSQHMGNLLKQFKDRIVDGLVLKSTKVSGSFSYWVELTDDTHLHDLESMSRQFAPGSKEKCSSVRLIK